MNPLRFLAHDIERLIYSYDDTFKPTMNPESIWCEIQTHTIDKARKRIFKKYNFETAMTLCFDSINTDDIDSDFDSDNDDDDDDDNEITENDLQTLQMINDNTYDIFD